ncbi:Yip1 family protein [Sphingomonas alpina]|uniref:YIP1 family protein n=1 Tax=Sphingomonas alpina TaxID=653931 RepID=A0A7H0LJW1_9SPHN|nr:Yip1 family protein [Sphingomonas alpina]QNQ09964.1 YIP1 family protein [Sphingomonas alpina]
MATQLPDNEPAGMVNRIKRLLLTPAAEWDRIDSEPMTVKGIFTGWVVPLAAIGPVAGLIGSLVFGYGAFGITYRPSITSALTTAVIGYALALAGTYVLALIIDALAPSFGATKNPVSALKVAAFSATAGWLAGIFQIVPALTFLGLLGLYSLYLLWIGLPKLMKAPADKAVPYVIVTMVVTVVVYLIIGGVAAAISSQVARPLISASAGTTSGTMEVPGVGKLDLGKLEEASKKMEAAGARMQADAASGKTNAVPAATLQALLPASVAGFTRGDTESTSGGAAGIGGSRAEGKYSAGDQQFTLSVADMAALGSLATLGGALNVQSSKQTSTGYEKTEMVGGAMVTEKWDTTDKRGKYETMAGSRFLVTAEGNVTDIATLKAAVAAIDTSKLAASAN